MNWFRIVLLAIMLGALLTFAWHSPVSPSDMSDSLAPPETPDQVQIPSDFDLQGHRGARGVRPENTWPAFQYALELGIPTLEMDVVISADGEVVVSHEPWMNYEICTTPDGEAIPERSATEHNMYRMTYEEIAAYDCGMRQHPSFPEQEPIEAVKPLLRDVLSRAESFAAETGRNPVFYNIETKSRTEWEGIFHPAPDVFAQHLIDVVEEAGVSNRTTIQSFDPRTLRYTHNEAPGLRLVLLIARQGDRGVVANLQDLGFVPHIYSPDYQLVDRAMMQAAQEHEMLVIPWTVNETSDMQRLIEIGVHGLITDYPARGQRVLAQMFE